MMQFKSVIIVATNEKKKATSRHKKLFYFLRPTSAATTIISSVFIFCVCVEILYIKGINDEFVFEYKLRVQVFLANCLEECRRSNLKNYLKSLTGH
jgi:predicted nucleotidyltransferase